MKQRDYQPLDGKSARRKPYSLTWQHGTQIRAQNVIRVIKDSKRSPQPDV
jgi:hypothetical protein